MESVAIPTPQARGQLQTRARRARGPLSNALARLIHKHLIGAAVFAVPLVALAWLAADLLYISDFHANTIAKDLLALDRGKLEFIGFSYPPAPFLLTLLVPTAFSVSVLTAIVGGIVAWLLWRDLQRSRLDPATRVVMLLGVVALPQYLYIATSRIEHTLTLWLLVLAWHRYLRFSNSGETAAGFLAGLLLGFGFFVNVAALPLAVILAGLAPLFVQRGAAAEGRGSRLAAIMVVMFPALTAFGSWAYLNWLFTGNWFLFINGPASPVRAESNVEAVVTPSILDALSATGADLARVPLYVAMFFVVANHGRRRALTFFAPVLVITLTRFFGFAYPADFAVVTYAVVALAAMPRGTQPKWAALLVPVAAFQMAYGWVNVPAGSAEEKWIDQITAMETLPQDRLDEAVASRLADLPRHSILADDTSAFRIVARTGSAAPYVLPADPRFDMALTAPARLVQYVLVADPSTGTAVAGDRITERYVDEPPPGFVTDAIWPGWKLYRLPDAPPVLTDLGMLHMDEVTNGHGSSVVTEP